MDDGLTLRGGTLRTLKRLVMQLEHGCGNHGCIIEAPKGMATNAGCTCSPRVIARKLRRLADALDVSNW